MQQCYNATSFSCDHWLDGDYRQFQLFVSCRRCSREVCFKLSYTVQFPATLVAKGQVSNLGCRVLHSSSHATMALCIDKGAIVRRRYQCGCHSVPEVEHRQGFAAGVLGPRVAWVPPNKWSARPTSIESRTSNENLTPDAFPIERIVLVLKRLAAPASRPQRYYHPPIVHSSPGSGRL